MEDFKILNLLSVMCASQRARRDSSSHHDLDGLRPSRQMSCRLWQGPRGVPSRPFLSRRMDDSVRYKRNGVLLCGSPQRYPTDREVSSIPRNASEKWVYPSQAQFFAAMARKRHNPRESDMKVIVPIHNAVNERAWGEVMKWEDGQGGDGCGGVKLVSFKGRPSDRTPRARWNILLGFVHSFPTK